MAAPAFICHKNAVSNENVDIYISETQAQHLMSLAAAKARAEAFGEVAAECRRKKKVVDMSEDGIGHSAQSFGQTWAYDNILEWLAARPQAQGDAEGGENGL